MHFTLRQMEIMRAVARTGSISDAARFLGVSQPSISTTLKQCAEVARFELFRRMQGRVVPTEEALALLPSLDRVFDCAEEVNALVSDLRNGDAGTVRIAATHALALSLLPRAVKAFRDTHRNVRLTVMTMLSRDVVDEVGSGRIDLGLVMSPYEAQGAHAIDLWTSELVCVAPTAHPIIENGVASPEQLSKYSLISFNRSLPLRQLIEEAFLSRGIPCHVAVEVGPSVMALQLVEQGVGCAIVDPFSIARYAGNAICVLPFVPRTKITAQLLTHTARPPTRAAAAFIETLRGVIPPLRRY